MPDSHKRTFRATKTWYEDADEYWKGVPSSVNGMLGGLEFVHGPDVRDSLDFITKMRAGDASGSGHGYACDCGAGIGRVSKHMLLSRFDKVDLVEQNKQFLDAAASQYLKPEIEAGRVGEMLPIGLQKFTPSEGRYDVVWCQWVLSHLTDDDLVAFLQRCVSGLAPGGVVCVKENIAAQGYVVDDEDSSVTRAAAVFERLFKSAGMAVVHTQMQTGLRPDMFADPEIAKAYEDVRDDKSETTWLLLTFSEGSKDALTVGHTGTGDIAELKNHLKEDAAAFGYIRVPMSNDELSQRTKFVLVVWIGKDVGVMRKAKLSVQKSDVIKVLSNYAVEIPAGESSELTADDILVRLRKAGGANYDRQASNY
ncbi:hypothetical protein LPJ61_000935 [Coemansia biformis]|uniref:Alpha N-terminal protein methyltransferase 1 n=1 Tax=Coemansia biformis TaxID=1286918 RepID=A0A9W7YGZ5_9FUNG|nr:hypothetical protein LPJ61_000935 [Coemansia biformis]